MDHLARFHQGHRIVAAFAVTQTIGYGVLYYAFSVFLVPMTRELHATGAQIAAALTGAVLTTAICAPLIGRWLDARGARALMTSGSILGTAAVLAWSRVQTLPQLYAVFLAIGVASAMVLYEPAFAVIVRWFDGQARANALLTLTIVAGFASSIFLPLTGLLVAEYGWRTALIVLAVGYGVAAIPLHALVLRHRQDRAAVAQPGRRADLVKEAVRGRPFRLLVVAFTAHGGATAVIGVLLVTYLIDLGHPPVLAATVAGLLGVMSVTGRLVTTGLRRRWAAARIAACVFAVQGVAALLLPVAGVTVPGAIGCVILFGIGFGVGTITLPHLLADQYGTAAYASLAGRVAFFSITHEAVAPLAAVALAQATGYTWVMAGVAFVCVVAAVALLGYQRTSNRAT